MPCKTLDEQRAYQRGYVAARRQAWFRDKACMDCGATGDLELDHRDPSEKTDHRIWSQSWARIEAEAAKCDVRCKSCHLERHAIERRKHGAGGYKRGCRCEVCREWKRQASARESRRAA